MTDEQSVPSSSYFTADDVEELVDRLDRKREAWRPEVGDKIAGVLTDIDEVDDTFTGGTYPLLVIEPLDSDHATTVHCFHVILKNEVTRRLSRGTMKLGDLVAIKYLGQGEYDPTSNRQNPHDYIVVVSPASAKE